MVIGYYNRHALSGNRKLRPAARGVPTTTISSLRNITNPIQTSEDDIVLLHSENVKIFI